LTHPIQSASKMLDFMTSNRQNSVIRR